MRAVAIAALVVALSSPAPAVAGTGDGASLGPLLAATDWLNGRATAASLRGKVVLVNVFTFDCFNCKNVTPNLRTVHSTEAGNVAIVGVHSPETGFEHVRSNVVTALREQRITWPVAIDNDMALWRAYGIEYWPTQLIFDKKGHLRKTVVGDSQDAEVDETIKKLAAEP